jgi:hypothetical protein
MKNQARKLFAMVPRENVRADLVTSYAMLAHD